jgi:hypothetical protein
MTIIARVSKKENAGLLPRQPGESWKPPPLLSLNTARDSFKFQKRRQLLITTSDKPLSVVAVRVNNPDRSPFAINR